MKNVLSKQVLRLFEYTLLKSYSVEMCTIAVVCMKAALKKLFDEGFRYTPVGGFLTFAATNLTCIRFTYKLVGTNQSNVCFVCVHFARGT